MTRHFIARYRNNLEWLKGDPVKSATYNIQGKLLTVETEDKELLFLLAERYGCFFSGGKASSSCRIKIKKCNSHYIFTDSSGKSSLCRHAGEVLYPYLTHTFDEIFENLSHHLVFHGSAFSTAFGGILILGRSGAGKTSLVLEMIKRGFSYISDDVSMVHVSRRNELIPNPLGFKLSPSLLKSQGAESSPFNDKYLSPGNIDNLEISAPCRLSAVILLSDEKSNNDEGQPACFGDYMAHLSELIIPPSERKSSLYKLEALFENVPFGVMTSSKEITVSKKAQNILDSLELNMNSTSKSMVSLSW